MTLPDVNILVNAFRTDSYEHEICRSWLDSVVIGEARYGMAPQVLSGVIRITTHPKVFAVSSGPNKSSRVAAVPPQARRG